MELDDEGMHYVGNLSKFLEHFFICMYFFDIVRHRIIFVFNTKRPISSLIFVFFW